MDLKNHDPSNAMYMLYAIYKGFIFGPKYRQSERGKIGHENSNRKRAGTGILKSDWIDLKKGYKTQRTMY